MMHHAPRTLHARDGGAHETIHFEVTAYSLAGRTASGTHVREGVAAADPDVLPFGSRVRLLNAGRYSGIYVVEDTGRAIEGRELDIYIPSTAEAKRFGRRRVEVEILRRGAADG
jgi:3D (Asp-Asp-Asp) domain-containing protein